ncbi:MAG: DUF423 domain-containing protein [Planctomycetota bacterium]|nr:DUF423 domain-containing protein [Planctomycetota bacterium]
MSARGWWVTGCLVGLLAVALGAFGAHGLRPHFAAVAERIGEAPAKVEGWYEVGVRYAAYHAVALLAVAWAASRAPTRAATAAGVGFVAGVVLFTGSLVVMGVTGARALGMITPLGGLGFMVGWGALALAGRAALAPGATVEGRA